jgi:hypothetical protein
VRRDKGSEPPGALPSGADGFDAGWWLSGAGGWVDSHLKGSSTAAQPRRRVRGVVEVGARPPPPKTGRSNHLSRDRPKEREQVSTREIQFAEVFTFRATKI